MKVVEHYLPLSGSEVPWLNANQTTRWSVDLPPFSQIKSCAMMNGRLVLFVETDEHTGDLEQHQLLVVPSNISFTMGINARFLATAVIGSVAFHVYYLGKQ